MQLGPGFSLLFRSREALLVKSKFLIHVSYILNQNLKTQVENYWVPGHPKP